jgi:signal transduction histidine kinase
VCSGWTDAVPTGVSAQILAEAVAAARPTITAQWSDPLTQRAAPYAYAAVLPILRGSEVTGALVIVGDARDPFAALDEDFLVALGQQVGAALENADLYERLQARTVELARLSHRMLEQHEEERRRLSRELHDETAQVFSAVKIELDVLREGATPPDAKRLDRALDLIDTGIRSIRAVSKDLRPSLLDDLGLVPALRSLGSEFAERTGLTTDVTISGALPALSKEAELALFRALQEALSNVARHAEARAVAIQLTAQPDAVVLSVHDDGRGLPPDTTPQDYERNGHMGLAGMRERIGALGGSLDLSRGSGGGVRLTVRMPLGTSQTA